MCLWESWDLFLALQQTCHHRQTSLFNPRAEAYKCLFLSRYGSVVEELIRDLNVVCPGSEVGSLPAHRALASFAVSPCSPAALAAGGWVLNAFLLLNMCDGFRWGLRLTGITPEQRWVVRVVGRGCCGVVWGGAAGEYHGVFWQRVTYCLLSCS